MSDTDDESPSTETGPQFDHDAPFDTVRRDALSRALSERFGMSQEDAQETATVVAQCFGDQLEVNDETLEPTVRSIFYTLEAKKILSFRREEYVWENGEKRRGFWWKIRDDAIAPVHTIPVLDAEEDVYASLPKNAWTTRQHA